MADAFLWGLVASASLLVGGVLALRVRFGNRALGAVMAFGAGTLISAVAYELVLDGLDATAGSGATLGGLFAGAATFLLGDLVIERLGAGGRKRIGASHAGVAVVPLVLGIVLDGVPESAVIGIGLLGGEGVGLAMLVAVFVSNLPEAIASTAGMRAGGWRPSRVLALWAAIVLVSAAASALGYAALGDAPPESVAFVKAFAAGAILAMLANTMMPEAFQHGGRLAGAFTVLGFAVAVSVALLEAA